MNEIGAMERRIPLPACRRTMHLKNSVLAAAEERHGQPEASQPDSIAAAQPEESHSHNDAAGLADQEELIPSERFSRR